MSFMPTMGLARCAPQPHVVRLSPADGTPSLYLSCDVGTRLTSVPVDVRVMPTRREAQLVASTAAVIDRARAEHLRVDIAPLAVALLDLEDAR
jgi:hypothetical protein